MKARTLGQEGFNVSEVGLGCWQLGGDWGTGIAEKKAFAILQAAVDNGITLFDTADVYGGGRSESLIGSFLQQTNAQVQIATKFGRSGGVYPDGYTEQALRDAVRASQERLQVDTIDLLQLHCMPKEELVKGDVFDWLRLLQTEGQIQHFGASVESVEQGLICLEQEGLQSLQVIYNVFRQKLTKELLPQAATKGVGIIVRLPLASGLLAGKFTADSQFADSDHRNYNKDGAAFNVGETFAGLPFEKGVALADQLKVYCPKGMSMAAFTQRWILDHPAVTTIIPGASRVEQVVANAQVSALSSLEKALMGQLVNFYEKEVHAHIRGVY